MQKSTLKRFGFSKPSSGLLNGETGVGGTTMDVLIKYNNRGNEKYIQRKII